MRVETWTDGKLTEQWDDASRTFTSWGADGEISESRPYTDQENADADARAAVAASRSATSATLQDKMTTALGNNAAFLALSSPTQAQTLAQVKALTRQVNAAMRYLTNNLDTTADT